MGSSFGGYRDEGRRGVEVEMMDGGSCKTNPVKRDGHPHTAYLSRKRAATPPTSASLSPRIIIFLSSSYVLGAIVLGSYRRIYFRR